MPFRMSVDTGGTFTDIVVSDGRRIVLIEKALPKSQELGVMIEDGDDPYPSKKDLGIHYCRYCNDAGCGACDCDCD